jgi:hypothetical protein
MNWIGRVWKMTWVCICRAWEWAGTGPNTQRLLVIFSLLLFCSTTLQWCVARQALHVTERPYVLYEAVSMQPNIARNGQPTFTMDFENDGRTPAFITDEQATFKVYERTLPTKPEYDRLPHSPIYAALPPNAKSRFNAVWPDTLPLTPGFVTDLKGGKKTLYVFGFVLYHDAFGAHHVTSFCFKYKPTDEPLIARFQGCGEPAYTYYR